MHFILLRKLHPLGIVPLKTSPQKTPLEENSHQQKISHHVKYPPTENSLSGKKIIEGVFDFVSLSLLSLTPRSKYCNGYTQSTAKLLPLWKRGCTYERTH